MDERKLKEATSPEAALIVRQLQLEMQNAPKQQDEANQVAEGRIFKKFSMWDAEFNQFMVDLTDHYMDSENALKTMQAYIYNQGIIDFFLVHSNALSQKFSEQLWGSSVQWKRVTFENMQNIRPYCFQKFYTEYLAQHIKLDHRGEAQKKYHEFLNKVTPAHEPFDWLQMQVVNILHEFRNDGEEPKDTAKFCRVIYEKIIKKCEKIHDELLQYGESISGQLIDCEPVVSVTPEGKHVKKIIFQTATRHDIDIEFIDIRGVQRHHTVKMDIPVIAIGIMRKLIVDFTAHTETVKQLEAYLANKGQIVDSKNRHSLDIPPYKPPPKPH